MGARVGQQAGGNGRAGRPEWRLGRDQGAGNTTLASKISAAPRPLKIVLQFARRRRARRPIGNKKPGAWPGG